MTPWQSASVSEVAIARPQRRGVISPDKQLVLCYNEAMSSRHQRFIHAIGVFSQKLLSPRSLFLGAVLLIGGVLTVLKYTGVLPLTLEYFCFYSILLFLFSLWRPTLAFLLFLGLIPLEIVTVTPPEWGIDLRPYQWVAIALGGALAVRLTTRRRILPLCQWSWLDAALSFFVFGVVLSGLVSGGGALKQSLVVVSFLYLYFLTRIFLKSLPDILQAIPFFTIPAAIVLGWGVIQNILFLSGHEAYAVMPGRPNGTLAEPDWLGLFVLALLALTFVVLTRRGMAEESWKRLLLPSLGLVGVWLVLILTVSRSAWLGAVALLVIFFFFTFKRPGLSFAFWEAALFLKVTIVTFVIALIIAQEVPLTRFILADRAESTASRFQTITVACQTTVLLPAAIEHVSDLTQYGCEHILLEERALFAERGAWITTVDRPDPNATIRQEIYRKSVGAIREHPLLGIGWGNIGPRLGTDERGASYNASNLWLEAWLGGGIIGLLGLVVFLGWSGWQLMRRAFQPGESSLLPAALLAFGAGLFVFDLFNSGLLLGFVWVFFALLAVGSSQKMVKS